MNDSRPSAKIGSSLIRALFKTLPPVGSRLFEPTELMALIFRCLVNEEETSINDLSLASGVNRATVRKLLEDSDLEIKTSKAVKLGRIVPLVRSEVDHESADMSGDKLETVPEVEYGESPDMFGDMLPTLPSPVKKGGLAKREPLEYSPAFEAFWKFYPSRLGVRAGKPAAWKSWQKIDPDEDLIRRIAESLSWQVLQPEWVKGRGKFVPMASTWLNNHRWEDELIEEESEEMSGLSDGAQEAIRKRNERNAALEIQQGDSHGLC